MAEGSAACQAQWVGPEKWKLGEGMDTIRVIFKAIIEIYSIHRLPPYPSSSSLVFFFPKLDPLPWGLHSGEGEKSVFFISCPSNHGKPGRV